jgi:ribosomal protein S27AE
MAQPQHSSPALPPMPFQRPACPRCKASMMLVSIERERPSVDLHTFQCAVCNDALTILAAHEDPMHSKSLGRWLQGDLHRPR